jgi:transcriptional regulator with XRE-family HTH domain
MNKHPLKFISETFNIPLRRVAKEIGVTAQTINEWVGKRRKPIPEKHIPKLSQLFGVREELFRKPSLNTSEQLEIQLAKIKQEIQDKDDQELVISILEEEIEKEKLFISLRKCVENDEQYEILKNVNRVLKQNNNLFNQTLQILLSLFNHDPEWGGDPFYGIQDEKLAEDLLHILKKHNIITW